MRTVGLLSVVVVGLSSGPLWASDSCSELFGGQLPQKLMTQEERSVKELTDIRNFDESSKQSTFRPEQIVIETSHIIVSVGIGPLPNEKIVLNIRMQKGNDPSYMKWLTQIVKHQFQDFAEKDSEFVWTKKGYLHFVLEHLSHREAKLRFSQMEKIISFAMAKPLDVIPTSLAKRNKSERREFLRHLLVDFLINQGVTSKAKFHNRNISLFHRLLIQELTVNEMGIFHYSIFDRDLTFEAQAQIEERVEKLNKVHEALRLEPVSAEALIESIRKKAVDIATALQKDFEQQEKDLEEARRVSNLYQQSAIEKELNRVRLEIEALESQIMEKNKYLKSLVFFGDEWKVLYPEVQELQRQVDDLNTEGRALLKKRAGQFKKNRLVIEKALALVKNDEMFEQNGNFNPYALDSDFKSIISKVKVRKVYAAEFYDPKTAPQIHDGKISDSIAGKALDRSPLDIENYGTHADMSVRLQDSIMNPEVVTMLRQVGIEYVYEVTKFSAEDYIEKFNFTEEQFHKLLDELNALGIHIYFDADWDRNELQIRKERPEFYQYRQTPGRKGRVRWNDGYIPEKN